jgi:tetratricopeptide (TPR) repeat protein
MTSAEQIYVFRHVIYREVAYQLHLPSERAHGHAEALEIIRQMFRDDIELVADELASHAKGAQEGAEPEEAERLLEAEKTFLKIALERNARGAYWSEVVHQGQRLLEICADPDDEVLELWSNYCEALRLVGRHDESVAQSQRLARHYAEQDRYGPASTRLVQAYVTMMFRGQLEQAAECLAKAEDYARKSGKPMAITNVLWRKSMLPGARGDTEASLQCLREAIEYATQHCPDYYHLPVMQADLAIALASRGRVEESLKLIEMLLPQIRRMDNEGNIATTLSNRGRHLAMVGRHDEAREAFKEALEINLRLGRKPSEAYVRGYSADVCIHQGELENAQEEITQATEMASEYGMLLHNASFLSMHAKIELLLGHLEHAQELIEQSRSRFENLGAAAYIPEYCNSIRMRVAACNAMTEPIIERETVAIRVAPPDKRWVRVVRELLDSMQESRKEREIPDTHELSKSCIAGENLHNEFVRALEQQEASVVFRGFLPSELSANLRRALLERLKAHGGPELHMLKHHPALLQAMQKDLGTII